MQRLKQRTSLFNIEKKNFNKFLESTIFVKLNSRTELPFKKPDEPV